MNSRQATRRSSLLHKVHKQPSLFSCNNDGSSLKYSDDNIKLTNTKHNNMISNNSADLYPLHENDDGCLGSLCNNGDRLVACQGFIIYFIMYEDAVYDAVYEAISDTVYDIVLLVVVYDDVAYDAGYDTVYNASMMQVIITYKYNDTVVVYNTSASAMLYAVYDTTVVLYAVYNTTVYDTTVYLYNTMF